MGRPQEQLAPGELRLSPRPMWDRRKEPHLVGKAGLALAWSSCTLRVSENVMWVYISLCLLPTRTASAAATLVQD